MTTEVAETKLIELFKATAGDGNEVTLQDGRKISQLGLYGTVLIDGKAVGELDDEGRFRLAQDLRQAARDAFTDPARNPMIKLA